jgi:Tripartite tricarboxylate transporter TctB family
LMLSCFSVFIKNSASDSPNWETSGRALAGWLGLMIATALFAWIGFNASFVILTVYLLVALDRRPFLLSAGVGLALALAFHLLFVRALDVSLPASRWGF